jgi:hypothetical protein
VVARIGLVRRSDARNRAAVVVRRLGRRRRRLVDHDRNHRRAVGVVDRLAARAREEALGNDLARQAGRRRRHRQEVPLPRWYAVDTADADADHTRRQTDVLVGGAVATQPALLRQLAGDWDRDLGTALCGGQLGRKRFGIRNLCAGIRDTEQ